MDVLARHKDVPTREPISEVSFAREETIGATTPTSMYRSNVHVQSPLRGNHDSQAPEKNPNKTANPTVPPISSTP